MAATRTHSQLKERLAQASARIAELEAALQQCQPRRSQSHTQATAVQTADPEVLPAPTVTELGCLEAILQELPVGVIVAEAPSGRIICGNKRIREMFGSGYHESQSVDDYANWHAHSLDGQPLDPHDLPLARALRGETVQTQELMFPTSDGSWIIVSINGSQVRTYNGNIVAAMVTVEDITYHRRDEEVLAEQKEQLLRLMHLLSMTNVFIRDLDNRIIYWTKGARRTYGFATEQAIGRDCAELLQTCFAEPPEQIRSNLLRTGRWEGEMTCVRQDGQTIIIASEWLLYRDSQDKPVAILEAGTEITDRKRAEDQLRELNQTLERRVAQRTAEAEQRAAQLQRLAAELTQAEQRERRRIAQILHDDLQQLLIGAKFHIHMLRDQLDDPQWEALAKVSELLDQSLEVSRSLTADLSPQILREGSLTELLQYLAEWAGQKYRLSVRLEVSGQPRQTGKDVRELLFQAVRELLLNVVKHARTDKAQVTLRNLKQGRLEIVVADQGAGLRPAGAAGTISPPSGGGFGLLSIRERLTLLGGSMDIESSPGVGTRVTLTAPCPPRSQEQAAPT